MLGLLRKHFEENSNSCEISNVLFHFYFHKEPLYFTAKQIIHCSLSFIFRISGTRETEINYPEEVGHVFTTIFHKYSERVRPYNNDRDPLDMTIILDVIHINNLDLLKQELDVTMDLSIVSLKTILLLL